MLRLSETPAPFSLDFLTLRKVVLGGSSSGKTVFGRVLYEEATAAGVLCGAIDLKGDWWGLKASADGLDDGIPVVVFGGDHADVPLEEGGGSTLADIVVELRQPFVIDLEALSKTKQLRFLATFLEVLYHRNREPLVLFCDEADRYAPQQPKSPEANTSLGAMEDLLKRGRKHGIFPVVISQRNASLNKGVSELCDVCVVFRTPGPRDQEAVEDWFSTNATRQERDQVMQGLASMPTGTAVLCSAHPDHRAFLELAIRAPRTFDSSATPRIGEARIEPKQLAAPDLADLKRRMAATIERARAEDPRELKRQLTVLQIRIRDLEARPMPIPGIPQGRLDAMLATVDQIEEAGHESVAQAKSAAEAQGERVGNLRRELLSLRSLPSPWWGGLHPSSKAPEPSQAPREGLSEDLGTTGEPILSSKTLQMILAALAEPPGDVHGLAQGHLALRIGVSGRNGGSGSFKGALAVCRRNGWIEGGGNAMRLTPAGLAALGPSRPPALTGTDLLERWLEKLTGTSRAVLEVIAALHPVCRDRILKEIGCRDSGTFKAALAHLRANRLILSPETGVFTLAPELRG